MPPPSQKERNQACHQKAPKKNTPKCNANDRPGGQTIMHHRRQVPRGGNLDLREGARENGRVDGVDGGCGSASVMVVVIPAAITVEFELALAVVVDEPVFVTVVV